MLVAGRAVSQRRFPALRKLEVVGDVASEKYGLQRIQLRCFWTRSGIPASAGFTGVRRADTEALVPAAVAADVVKRCLRGPGGLRRTADRPLLWHLRHEGLMLYTMRPAIRQVQNLGRDLALRVADARVRVGRGRVSITN